eukprot:6214214-Pleurochrysis_carterae.AAC.1
MAHTDWNSKEVIRELKTATFVGKPACPDTTSEKLPEDTRERGPCSVRVNVMEQTLSIPLYNMATSQVCCKCHAPVSAPESPKNISLQCVADLGAAYTAIRYDQLQMLGETQIHLIRLRFHGASNEKMPAKGC